MATPEMIANHRNTFKELGFEVEGTTYNDVVYPYFVIPPEWDKLPKNLPKYFAFQLTPSLDVLKTKSASVCALFGVSSAIAPEFRPLVALHEILEYVVHPLEHNVARIDHACLVSSAVEHAQLHGKPSDFYRAYVKMRAEFFAELVTYATATGAYNETLLDQFQKSATYWAQLVRQES